MQAAAFEFVSRGGGHGRRCMVGVFRLRGIMRLFVEVVGIPRGRLKAVFQLGIETAVLHGQAFAFCFFEAFDLRRQPGGMDDAQVSALQQQGLFGKPCAQFGFFFLFHAMPRRVMGVFFGADIEKPAGAVFRVIGENVQFVIAQNHPCPSAFISLFEPRQHRGAVGAAVAQIADEHQPPPARMETVVAVAEPVQQQLEGGKFAVNIADDVQRRIGQGLAV